MDAKGLQQLVKNLDLLVSCTEAATSFYQECHRMWPEERTFWSDLAADGLVRTTRLQLMGHRAKDSNSAARSIRIFKPEVLATFHAWIEKNRSGVRSGAIGQRAAAAIARELERSPILNEHYVVGRWTDQPLANYLLSFATDYGKHAQHIEQLLGRPATARMA